MADMKTFRLLVNTPDRVFYNDDVTMVELSTTEGEIGVYAEHIPLTSVLVPCVMNIHVDGDVKKAAVHGGIVEILQDKVTVDRKSTRLNSSHPNPSRMPSSA